MNDIVFGIKDKELGLLSLEVLDYSDRISAILDKIDSRMADIAEHYQGDSYKELMNYYSELKNSYSNIKDNIVSYSDDLAALIIKAKQNDKTLASLFDEFTVDVKQQIKSING